MASKARTEAMVELVRGRKQWMWRVLGCPFCRQEHWHSGGPFEDDPRRCLGSRSPHCSLTRVGMELHPPAGEQLDQYVLVETSPGAEAIDQQAIAPWLMSWRGGPNCQHKHRTHITAARCGTPVAFTGGLRPAACA